MSRNIVITPKCPICLKMYDSVTLPKTLYPCGHGMCSECLVSYAKHGEENDPAVDLKCPLCREPIVQEFDNYDLQSITNNVNTNTLSYWTQRLLETMDKDGEEIVLNDELIPFSKTIVTRVCYRNDFKIMDKLDIWSKDDHTKVHALCKTFVEALQTSNTTVDKALKWIEVLNVPPSVENQLITKINKFFTAKSFLETMDAEWLMDALLD